MTGDRPPPGPEPTPGDADPLAAFLKLARREGALDGENLEAFAAGFRKQAERVIEKRLGRAESRVGVLETENQWQRDSMATLQDAVAALEKEKAWLFETMRGLEAEKVWLRETVGALEAEKAWLREITRALEAERIWLRESVGALEVEKAWLRETLAALEAERAWLRETVGALEAEALLRTKAIEDAGEERRKATAAHDTLLAHHRELMARVAGQLGEIASLSPIHIREARRRLRTLSDLLRADTL